jgi:hypothetical protein
VPKTSLTREVRTIRTALRQIVTSLDRLAPLLASVPAAANSSRPRRPLSPARRAALKLQGSYLGYMRQLKMAEKAKVRRIRESKGIRPAIAAARRMAAR